MTVSYRRSNNQHRRCSALYDTWNPPTSADAPPPRPTGPFESCGDCPYPTHGFLCYGKEGDCLRTDMQRIYDRKKPTKEETPYEGGTQ